MTAEEEALALEEAQKADAKNQELMRAYQVTFNSQAGQTVLIDLMQFGKFRVPIDGPTDEGKRQVVCRIVNMTQLSIQQLYAAYRGKIAL